MLTYTVSFTSRDDPALGYFITISQISGRAGYSNQYLTHWIIPPSPSLTERATQQEAGKLSVYAKSA